MPGGPQMSGIQVRPFRRSDRDQLTSLVNAHAGAVVPGMAVSVNTVLASLERRPGEFIEERWVSDRATLVAEQQGRGAAAAHRLRYYPDERAGPSARDSGDINWLLFWPEAPAGNPFWTSGTAAADALIDACLSQLGRWGVAAENAGGGRLVPARYGIPHPPPHITDLYTHPLISHICHSPAP